jgi:hypothetical protein
LTTHHLFHYRRIIEGHATVPQKTNQVTNKIRIIGFLEQETFNTPKSEKTLMSTEFPTIWLEMIRTNNKNLLVCGFHQEWTRNDDSRETGQSQRMKIIIEQMERAEKENKYIKILGDANLCA